MGRIKEHIDINGKKYWALFDTGARNTYIVKDAAANLQIFDLPEPNPVSLGGKIHNVVKCCYMVCKIEGYNVTVLARILDDIGTDEDDKKIEILIGALAMQEWGIRLIPEKEMLDMSHYPKEFIEF